MNKKMNAKDYMDLLAKIKKDIFDKQKKKEITAKDYHKAVKKIKR